MCINARVQKLNKSIDLKVHLSDSQNIYLIILNLKSHRFVCVRNTVLEVVNKHRESKFAFSLIEYILDSVQKL